MNKFIMFIVVLSVAGSSALASEMVSTDHILDSLLKEVCNEIANQIPAIDTLSVSVSIHPDAEFVETIMLEALGGRSTVISRTSTNNLLRIVIKDMSTRYSALLADSIQRVITVSFTGILELNGVVKPLTISDRLRTDVGSRKEAAQAESQQHAASHGQMPDPERTFWDDILEPAIFVAAAATTVILLFTVRSK